MNIIDDQFNRIVQGLQPLSSFIERTLVAKRLGMSESSIAKVRDGRNKNPSREVMSKLYDYLFVDIGATPSRAPDLTNSVGQAVAVAPISSDRRDGYEGRV